MSVSEALLLGLASGPACLGSCGPVLLPFLAAGKESSSGTAARLAQFLAGRLAAYLVFAAAAWAAGAAIPREPEARLLAVGLANVAIAGLLAWYVIPRRRKALPDCAACGRNAARPALLLGLLTGLSLCPPFIAAAARAAEAGGLVPALFFFIVFFLGTALWFVPVTAIGLLHRLEAPARVARITMGLLAVYYGWLGLSALLRRFLHG